MIPKMYGKFSQVPLQSKDVRHQCEIALLNSWVSSVFGWFLTMGYYCTGQGQIVVICVSSQLLTAF